MRCENQSRPAAAGSLPGDVPGLTQLRVAGTELGGAGGLAVGAALDRAAEMRQDP